jgi:putative thioredoxin
MSTAAPIVDVTTATFVQEVVERSRTTPVLVDLWATWCGPCKTLGPTLEKLAREMNGKFVLAKIDVDQNPEIADAFQVQSIPTVLLLVGGRPVDGFVGAQPEKQIRDMLARHLGAQVDPLEEALALEKDGHAEQALARVERLAAQRPPHKLAAAHRARLLVQLGQVDEGRKAWEALSDEDKDSDPGRAAKALLAMQGQRGDLAPLQAQVAADSDDVAARLAYGRALIAAGRAADGLEQLYEGAKRDLRYNDSEPRKALIEAFEALSGAEPQLVAEYRRRLSVLLCS